MINYRAISTKRLFGVTSLLLLGLMIFNQWQIGHLRSMMGMESAGMLSLDNFFGQVAEASVIPGGMPEMAYGRTLGVNFDQPEAAIKILESYDRGAEKITLAGAELQRYVKIGKQTSCEYCCAATTLVFDDGRAACGCAHSAAMRGLLAYLIQNHGAEYGDEELLTEVNRWKAVFFPKQTWQKALASQSETGRIDPDIINQMPAMVGGC